MTHTSQEKEKQKLLLRLRRNHPSRSRDDPRALAAEELVEIVHSYLT
jgi:hypothetical protein